MSYDFFLDPKQSDLEHIQKGVEFQDTVLDGGTVFADGGNGTGGKRFLFVGGQSVRRAHGKPSVKRAAAVPTDDRFRYGVVYSDR